MMQKWALSVFLTLVCTTAATYSSYRARTPSQLSFYGNKNVISEHSLASNVDLSTTVDELSKMGRMLKQIHYGETSIHSTPQVVKDKNGTPARQRVDSVTAQPIQGHKLHQKHAQNVGQVQVLPMKQEVRPHNQPTYAGAYSHTSLQKTQSNYDQTKFDQNSPSITLQHVQPTYDQSMQSMGPSSGGTKQVSHALDQTGSDQSTSQVVSQHIQLSYNQPTYGNTYLQTSRQLAQPICRQTNIDQHPSSMAAEQVYARHDQNLNSLGYASSGTKQSSRALNQAVHSQAESDETLTQSQPIHEQPKYSQNPSQARSQQFQPSYDQSATGQLSSQTVPQHFTAAFDQQTLGDTFSRIAQQRQNSYGRDPSQANAQQMQPSYHQRRNEQVSWQAKTQQFVSAFEQQTSGPTFSQAVSQQGQPFYQKPSYGQHPLYAATQPIKALNNNMMTSNIETSAATYPPFYDQDHVISTPMLAGIDTQIKKVSKPMQGEEKPRY